MGATAGVMTIEIVESSQGLLELDEMSTVQLAANILKMVSSIETLLLSDTRGV